MNFRDWLIVIGLIVIVGLIIDALRRLWFQKRLQNEITFGLERSKGAEDQYSSELPNGGARLKSGGQDTEDYMMSSPENEVRESHQQNRRVDPVFSGHVSPLSSESVFSQDDEHEKEILDSSSASSSMSRASHEKGEGDDVFQITSLQLAPAFEPIVPVEAWASHNDAIMSSSKVAASQSSGTVDLSEHMSVASVQGESYSPYPVVNEQPVKHETTYEHSVTVSESESVESNPQSTTFFSESIESSSAQIKPEEAVFKQDDHVTEEFVQEEPVQENAQPDTGSERCEGVLPVYQSGPKEMLVIHLESKAGDAFSGDQVLQVLLDNGLRLGEMNVFHCVRSDKNQGKDVLFSVANGMEPGTFDLKTMRDQTFSILTFFMALPGPQAPVDAFKTMVDAVDTISRHLYADVKDDQHCLMSLQMLEYYRQKAADYQRLQMLENQMG